MCLIINIVRGVFLFWLLIESSKLVLFNSYFFIFRLIDFNNLTWKKFIIEKRLFVYIYIYMCARARIDSHALLISSQVLHLSFLLLLPLANTVIAIKHDHFLCTAQPVWLGKTTSLSNLCRWFYTTMETIQSISMRNANSY